MSQTDNTLSTPRVIIVGGGAAGYFAAIECARLLKDQSTIPYDVVILEATNNPLSKVKISGGGRCNVMHDPTKGHQLIAKGYPRGSKELLGPFTSKFGPLETYEWFQSRGIQLKTESDGRVFPTTDSSSTIINALIKTAKDLNIRTICGATVKNTIVQDKGQHNEKFTVAYSLKQTNENSNSEMEDESKFKLYSENQDEDTNSQLSNVDCDYLIFSTGSSRLGYKLMNSLGHALETPIPSLFSFRCSDESVKKLAGTTVEKVQAKIIIPNVSKDDKLYDTLKTLTRPQSLPNYVQQGPLLFTHQGMSGPSILRLSAFGAKLLHLLDYKFSISVNYLPSMSYEEIYDLLMQEKINHPKRLVSKAFPGYAIIAADERGQSSNPTTVEPSLPLISRRLWMHLLLKAGITKDDYNDQSDEISSDDIRWEKVTKVEIDKISQQLLNSVYEIKGRGQYKDEFVTCGGIKLKELNFESLESKLQPNLFLAGELIDVDGVTGGYNLQSAWTTGWIAGHNAALKIIQKSLNPN